MISSNPDGTWFESEVRALLAALTTGTISDCDLEAEVSLLSGLAPDELRELGGVSSSPTTLVA